VVSTTKTCTVAVDVGVVGEVMGEAADMAAAVEEAVQTTGIAAAAVEVARRRSCTTLCTAWMARATRCCASSTWLRQQKP
jgi:hypothetical protein